MIIGMGTDIVQTARIASSIERLGERFINRILGDEEKQVFVQKKDGVSYLAKRFAAKEAFAKAMGTGIGQYAAFTDIQILNDHKGKPTVTLTGAALKWSQQNQVAYHHVSLSDERDYAQAFVIIEAVNVVSAS